VKDNMIAWNTSDVGGGIECPADEDSVVTGNRIVGNEAYWGGGAIFAGGVSPVFRNNLIAGNEAYEYGGGIHCGRIYPLHMANNTITGNTAAVDGGGIYCYDADLMAVNVIFWGNTPDEIYVDLGTATITYSDVQGGYPGTGNIDADPLFVRGPLGAYYLSQTAAGQPADSPCVDAGDSPVGPSFPGGPSVFGTTRTDLVPDAGIIDMGYHYPLTGIRIPPGALLKEAGE
jgi:predicted outer membrane repeat protein